MADRTKKLLLLSALNCFYDSNRSQKANKNNNYIYEFYRVRAIIDFF